MLSLVMIGIGDFDRAYAFYAALAAELGLKPVMYHPSVPVAAWRGADDKRPNLFIDRPTVDRCHALALAHGGDDEGAPGLRAYYHPNYYGAYFRDPDGNKLCVVCHVAP